MVFQLSLSLIKITFMKNTLTRNILSFLASTFLGASAFGQTELAVNCYDTESIYNSYSLNGAIVEYSICSMAPSFYVAVIDPSNCTPWGTNYQGANPSHFFGNINEGSCRQRVEYFFVFEQHDSLQLDGMLNMLQQIPAGHSIVIYTPFAYDYSAVNAVNSNLSQELSSRWDVNIIEGNQIMVLYGEQGVAGSYITETQVNQDGYIAFTHSVCNGLGVNEDLAVENLLISASLNQIVLNPELALENMDVFDAMGRKTPFQRNGNVLSFNQSVEAGVYLIRMNLDGQIRQLKVMLGN